MQTNNKAHNRRRAEAWLKEQVPALNVANRAEFKHRVQWLSEGMLNNHLKGVIYYKVDPAEIEIFEIFVEKLRGQSHKVTI